MISPFMDTRFRWLAGAFCALFALITAGAALAQSGQAPPARPSVRHKPAALDAECAFTGRRIVSSLARDDVDAAQKFVRFYEMFSCPTEHLRVAFRCAVKGGAPAPGKPLSERVDECWDKAPIASTGR